MRFLLFKPDNQYVHATESMSGRNNISKHSHALTNSELVEGCIRKDPMVMKAVYESFKTSIFNISYRYTGDKTEAEDLSQEIFIKIFQHIQKLKETDAFKNWIYRIAVNSCLNHIRSDRLKKRKENQHKQHNALKVVKNGSELLRMQIEQGIQMLPIKQKSVFILHDIEGFTHHEIAIMMGWSDGTSKSQLFKARMKMRAYLK